MNQPEIKEHLSHIELSISEIRNEFIAPEPNAEKIWGKAAAISVSAQIICDHTSTRTKLTMPVDANKYPKTAVLTQRFEMLFLLIEAHYFNQMSKGLGREELQSMAQYITLMGLNTIYIYKGFKVANDQQHYDGFHTLVESTFNTMIHSIRALKDGNKSLDQKHKECEELRSTGINNLVVDVLKYFGKMRKEEVQA